MFQKLSNILLILLISLKLFPSRFLFSQSSENYLSNYIFFKILYNKQFSILLKYYLSQKILERKRKNQSFAKKVRKKISTIIHFDDETRNNYAKLEKRVFEKTTNIDRCVHDDKRAQKCFGRYHCLADTGLEIYPVSATCSRVPRHYDAGIWRARLGASGRFAFEAHATDVRRNRFIFSSRMNEIVPCYDTRFIRAFFFFSFYILQYIITCIRAGTE